MKTVNAAFTAPVNPPGAEPAITLPQLWAGLQRKIRHAEEFVSAITACRVLSDDGDTADGTVEREAVFADGRTVRERVRSVFALRIDFAQPDGGLVTNSISHGADGGMFLTYSFQWGTEAEQGGAEWEAERGKVLAQARMAVEGSLDTVRRMVREGKL